MDRPDHVRASFGANYERLAALKEQWDPTNVFRHTQNIKPTVEASCPSHPECPFATSWRDDQQPPPATTSRRPDQLAGAPWCWGQARR